MPSTLRTASANVVSAETAAEMHEAVLAALPGCDALIMAAAVADFRPLATASTKIAREDGLDLQLEPTADILAEAASVAHETGHDPTARPVIVGFAAETGSIDRAPDKAARKGRNPQTNEPIVIARRRVLTFKPSQVLRAALNESK